MNIRPVSAAGADILTAIHRQCFPHYWNSDAFTDFFSVAGTLALVAELVGSDQRPAASGKPLALTADHRPLAAMAMCVYRVQHEQADILTLAVLPAWRKQGIGRLLLEKMLSDSAILGAKNMFLDVEEGNFAATRLYQAYGFAPINRRKQYYRQKDGSFTDALVMTRKL